MNWVPESYLRNMLSADGRIVRSEEPILRLKPHFLECVVYAYQDTPSAEEAARLGATAFLVAVDTLGGPSGFIVTNRHVIEDGFCTFRVNNREGGTAIFETEESNWSFHQDKNWDIAVHPYSHRDGLFLHEGMFLRETDIDKLDVRLGDEAALIGRFITHAGIQTNTPTARFGYVAQMPGDLILDRRGRKQRNWLVQVHSLPGFSGAPVLLMQNAADKGQDNAHIGQVVHTTGPGARLLGMNCGHFDENVPVFHTRSETKSEELISQINTGIANVLPAWIIREAIVDFLKRNTSASGILTGGFGFGGSPTGR